MTSALSDYGAGGTVFKEVKFSPSAGSTALRDALAVSELGPEFVQSLQEVSADAALWQRGGANAASDGDWDGCVYAAYIYAPGATPESEPGQPLPQTTWLYEPQCADLVISAQPQPTQTRNLSRAAAPGVPFMDGLNTRGTMYQTPSTLNEFITPVVEAEKASAQGIPTLLIRKLKASDSFNLDPDVAALHHSGRVHVNKWPSKQQLLAYLFDDVFVIAEETLHDLQPISVIHLGNIDIITPLWNFATNSFALRIDCTSESAGRGGFVFTVRELDDAIRWVTKLGCQTCISKLTSHPSIDIESFVDSEVLTLFVAAMDTWSWHKLSPSGPPVELGRLQHHSHVQNTAERRSSFMACLFDHYLLFLARDGQQLPILQGYVHLDDVVALDDRSQYVIGDAREILCVRSLQQHPTSAAMRCEFVFDLGTPRRNRLEMSNATLWKNAIELRVPGACFVDLTFEDEGYHTQRATRASTTRTSSTLQTYNDFSSSATAPAVVSSTTKDNTIAGVVFLSTSVGGNVAEYNLSLTIRPEKQSQRIGTSAIAHALSVAFDTFNAHRVQARILHPAFANDEEASARLSRAVSKFLHMGFTHEGVRRRAVAHPVAGIWMDVTVLALLDYDWTLKRLRPPPPKMTLWEEMFMRQQNEHEAVIRMNGGWSVKRDSDAETVRNLRTLNEAAVTPSLVGTSVAFPDSVSNTSSIRSLMSSWDTVSTPATRDAAASADDAADEYAAWDDFEDVEFE